MNEAGHKDRQTDGTQNRPADRQMDGQAKVQIAGRTDSLGAHKVEGEGRSLRVGSLTATCTHAK